MKDTFTDNDFHNFVGGHQRTFRRMFDFFYPIILRYAYSKTKSLHHAEEITQEAFIQLYLNRHKVTSVGDIYPYLFVITKRLCISHFRQSLRSAHVDISEVEPKMEIFQHLESDIHFAELQSVLDQIVDTLPPQQKKIYRMSRMDAMPQQEIAAKMGISRHTVKNHLLSATKTVRIRLEKFYSYLLSAFIILVDLYG